MAPFNAPKAILQGLKDGIGAITVQGDRMYVGTVTGNIHVYELGGTSESDASARLIEIKQGVTRRAIDQLGFVKDANSLAVLSTGDAIVTLLPLPSLSPPTVLAKAKTAMSFGIHTSVQKPQVEEAPVAEDPAPAPAPALPPSVITRLVIGCKRRVVVYTWVDGEAQEPKEAPLLHSPRAVAFFGPNAACLAYPANDYGLLNIIAMSAVDIAFPTPPATSVVVMGGRGMGMGALTGLFSAKAKPTAVSVNDREVLIVREGRGMFIGSDGKQTRAELVEWPTIPEDTCFVKPYVFTIFPPNTVPASSTNDTSAAAGPFNIAAPVVQVMSSLSSGVVQTCAFPFPMNEAQPSTTTGPNSPENHTLRLLTPSSGSKPYMLAVSTPTEKTALAAEGSTIWSFRMQTWAAQVDELVRAGAYQSALSLLDSIDEALLPDKAQRVVLVRKLNAVAQYRAGEFDKAIDTFIQCDVNPAKVVALFAPAVAGRLSVSPDEWIPLFGGPSGTTVPASSSEDVSTIAADISASKEARPRQDTKESVQSGGRGASPMGSIRETLKTGLDAIIPSALKDDDTASIKAKRKTQTKDQISKQSIETLLRYLSDRRPQIDGALATHLIGPSQASAFPPLSITPISELFALPDLPFPSLAPAQLVHVAQIVYTALFKSYLVVRPGLLGPLCRTQNWCEVSEVEEELGARGKNEELVDLYKGKKMHTKALHLLRRLSDKETDADDKLRPTIRYLQHLGPEYIEATFDSSRWVIGQDRDKGFEIFTSEEVDLPPDRVADFMESIDSALCARYLEYIISDRGEVSRSLHDRLAELYLRILVKDKASSGYLYPKFLHFIETNQYYQVDRLFGLLPSEDLFEARAILLGKLGRHEHALELYVYRLKDYLKAEQYCKSIYQTGTSTEDVYLSLLRIYLQPRQNVNEDLLKPALELVGRHGPRLDPVETLNLIPTLVTAKDLRPFLMDALRAPIFDKHVVREISKARQDQASIQLTYLQSQRVKVTDSRICPQCHKRLGTSVIAVHAPRGEVTHYQCREQFAQKLKGTRK